MHLTKRGMVEESGFLGLFFGGFLLGGTGLASAGLG